MGDVEKSTISIQDLGKLLKEDLLIVCSDGVHEVLDGLQIQQMISVTGEIENAIDQIEQRLMNEAKDNFSFIFLHDDPVGAFAQEITTTKCSLNLLNFVSGKVLTHQLYTTSALG